MLVGRRKLAGLVAAATAAVVLVGVQVAVAQQDAAPDGVDDGALLARLDVLETQLPAEIPPTAVEFDEDRFRGTVDGDFTSTRAVLDTLEPELRRLFVDADDQHSEVAAAVSDIARGWLELHEGLRYLAAYEAHDLEYPIDARDDEGVAVDADELRGSAQVGFQLLVSARQRQLDGYRELQRLGAADPDAQARLDTRALEGEAFDRDLRPLLLELPGMQRTQFTVPESRFSSAAPGSEARARSMTIACVDREGFRDAVQEVLDSGRIGALDTLGTAERADCPDLPPNVEVRPVD